jgi:hypothetical protein
MHSLSICSSIFDCVRLSRLMVEDSRHDMSGEFPIPTHSSQSKITPPRILFDRLSIFLYGQSNTPRLVLVNTKASK